MISLISLLGLTNLIKEGSAEIWVGDNSITVERDVIQVDICDTMSPTLFDREDILSQIRQLSEEFCSAQKTLVIKYNHSRVLTLGAHANSVVLQLLGMNHVAVGNPVTVYKFLRKWGK